MHHQCRISEILFKLWLPQLYIQLCLDCQLDLNVQQEIYMKTPSFFSTAIGFYDNVSPSSTKVTQFTYMYKLLVQGQFLIVFVYEVGKKRSVCPRLVIISFPSNIPFQKLILDQQMWSDISRKIFSGTVAYCWIQHHKYDHH